MTMKYCLLFVGMLGVILALPHSAQAQKKVEAQIKPPAVIFIDPGTHPLKVEGVPANWNILYVIKSDPEHYWVVIRSKKRRPGYALYNGTEEGLLRREIIGTIEFTPTVIFISTQRGVLQLPTAGSKAKATFGDKRVRVISPFKRNP
jgi:hypothetical protein